MPSENFVSSFMACTHVIILLAVEWNSGQHILYRVGGQTIYDPVVDFGPSSPM